MDSLDELFTDLRRHLSDPKLLDPVRGEPLCYAVHTPHDSFTIRRKLPSWRAQLAEDRLELVVVSLADVLWRRIDQTGLWPTYLALEGTASADKLAGSIAQAIGGAAGPVS